MKSLPPPSLSPSDYPTSIVILSERRESKDLSPLYPITIVILNRRTLACEGSAFPSARLSPLATRHFLSSSPPPNLARTNLFPLVVILNGVKDLSSLSFLNAQTF